MDGMATIGDGGTGAGTDGLTEVGAQAFTILDEGIAAGRTTDPVGHQERLFGLKVTTRL